LFENVIITFIGGAIGFVLALLVIYFINESGALPDSILAFNWRVFGLSFLLCLVFGVLSGMLPAWRMSRMHIVKGLHS
jgi:putative ABC transport system permease protein